MLNTAERGRPAASVTGGGPSGGAGRPAVRRALLALAGGGLLFAAHPPLGLGPIGLVALVPLIALARDVGAGDRRVRAGLGWGLVAGVAFFGPLLYWIAHVELVALPLLVAAQSVTVGAFVAGLALWAGRPGWPLAAVVWWVALEAVRSSAPWGGFPWGVLGYSQHDAGLLLPLARSLGVLGVSAACAAVAAAVEEAIFRLRSLDPAWWESPELAFASVRTPVLAAIAVLAGAVLLRGEPPPTTGNTLDVAAVQGNDILDTRSLTRSRIVEIAERMVALTEEVMAAPGGPPDVVVWPENALDADVTRGGEAPAELRRLVERALDALDGTPLLTGMLRTHDGRELNTMTLVGRELTALDVYAKRSLVPFGEFIPLRGYLGWLPPLARAGNFSAGDDPTVFSVAGARVATVICFENNFPELARSQVREGAQVLIVSTNNASFGVSPASDQHIAFSQVRAVESGRWVLHAGLSGVSAVIDPQGRVSMRTGLFEQATIRAELPLVDGVTPFTRTGDVVGRVSMLLAAAAAVVVAVQAALPAARRRRASRSAHRSDVGSAPDQALM